MRASCLNRVDLDEALKKGKGVPSLTRKRAQDEERIKNIFNYNGNI